jgi:hypothetical protein
LIAHRKGIRLAKKWAQKWTNFKKGKIKTRKRKKRKRKKKPGPHLVSILGAKIELIDLSRACKGVAASLEAFPGFDFRHPPFTPSS